MNFLMTKQLLLFWLAISSALAQADLSASATTSASNPASDSRVEATVESDRELSNCQKSYILKEGDTFAKIARERLEHLEQKSQSLKGKNIFGPNGPVKQISDLNKNQFKNPNQIKEGIEIRLPASLAC